MATKNDITGDSIRSKINTKTGYDAYREGWERIFGKSDKSKIPVAEVGQIRKDRRKV